MTINDYTIFINNRASIDLIVALDPAAFRGEGENAATRRYLAEAIVNRIDFRAEGITPLIS